MPEQVGPIQIKPGQYQVEVCTNRMEVVSTYVEDTLTKARAVARRVRRGGYRATIFLRTETGLVPQKG